MNVLKLPAFGMSARRGKIVEWLVKEGDTVKANEPLYNMQSEKSSITVEAPYDLIVRKIIHQEGDFDVGTPIAIVSLPDEEFDEQELNKLLSEILNDTTKDTLGEKTEKAKDKAPKDIRNIKATPLARKLAAELKVNLENVIGSGPDGLITDRDVKKYIEEFIEEENYQLIRLTGFAEISAEHLTESWKNIPHIVQFMEVNANGLVNAREKLISEMKFSYTDLLVKLVAITLEKHPRLNATMEKENEIKNWKKINISVAIETPHGLTVPVIKNADEKSLQEIHKEIEKLAEKSRQNKLAPSDISGGTFTISNLGTYGAELGFPIINAPQVALLYIGAIRQKPWIVDGKIDIAMIISLSLACDHRAIDGAVAARFAKDLREAIENAETCLL